MGGQYPACPHADQPTDDEVLAARAARTRPLTREAARQADQERAGFADWFAPETRQEPHSAQDLAGDEDRLVALGYRVERAQDGDRAILRLYRGAHLILQARLWRLTEQACLADWRAIVERSGK